MLILDLQIGLLLIALRIYISELALKLLLLVVRVKANKPLGVLLEVLNSLDLAVSLQEHLLEVGPLNLLGLELCWHLLNTKLIVLKSLVEVLSLSSIWLGLLGHLSGLCVSSLKRGELKANLPLPDLNRLTSISLLRELGIQSALWLVHH